MRRTAVSMGVVLLLLLCAGRSYAACYTCAIGSTGVPYCKTKSSGGEECYTSTSPTLTCVTYGQCGGTGEPEPVEPITESDCGRAERWYLASVELPRANHPPSLVLTMAFPAAADQRSTLQ